ncbi:hypothetical protein [Phreatobacter sp.]|uniref:hypothetical protein n=1 Tax=Phreatobacter sp. TaxID=1966341 RepID=UPI003F6FF61B
MLHRRSFLAAAAGGLAVAAIASRAEAAPAPTPMTEVSDAPRTVGDLRQSLAGEPREMQYYYYRRPRRYYYRRPRMVRRCWWTNYGRVCRWVRVW